MYRRWYVQFTTTVDNLYNIVVSFLALRTHANANAPPLPSLPYSTDKFKNITITSHASSSSRVTLSLHLYTVPAFFCNELVLCPQDLKSALRAIMCLMPAKAYC